MTNRRTFLIRTASLTTLLAATPIISSLSKKAVAGEWEKDSDFAIGSPNAPVSLIEYFSLSCPHCRDFHIKTFPELKMNYIDNGKVRFISRDFPLNRPALDAAILAQCSGPERYFAFIETLFHTFDKWTRSADYLQSLKQLGELGGISNEAFQTCLDSGSIETNIFNIMLEGQKKYAVESTPTFIINGKKYKGSTRFDKLSKALDQYLVDI